MNSEQKIVVVGMIAILFAILLSSCTDTSIDAPVSEPTDVIMPLKAGNVWLYTAKGYTDDSLTSYTWEGDTRAVFDTVVNGSRWTRMKNDGDLLQNRLDGLYGKDIRDLAKNGITGIQRLIPYPAQAKKTYMFFGKSALLDSTNAIVKTPAGEFICYKFITEETVVNNRREQVHQYWAPNYGYIQSVCWLIQADNSKKFSYVEQLKAIILK